MSTSINSADVGPSGVRLLDPDMNVGYLLNTVRSRFMQDIDSELHAFGMTAAQFIILRRIANGSAGTAAELCRVLHYDTGSMTRMLDRLEEKSLITRERSPDDRRVVQIRLTQSGNEMFPQLSVAAAQAFNKHLAVFTDEEFAQLERLLKRLVGIA